MRALVGDPYNLQRFVHAQQGIYEQARAELHAGEKRSHWMWFIFPQLAGLGSSPMAQKYAISSLNEAKVYLQHSVLGPRLIECAELVNRVSGRSIHEIFGYPDDLKFRSSMTLFGKAEPSNAHFRQALDKYFEGRSDSRTLQLLGMKE
jgi:uncharacterized protein (DUF1810 family)